MLKLVKVFQALTDPTRVKIITLLREQDLTPSEMLAKMSVSQPTLSHHLDILKRADLIRGERQGQFIRYSLNMSVLQMAIKELVQFMRRS